ARRKSRFKRSERIRRCLELGFSKTTAWFTREPSSFLSTSQLTAAQQLAHCPAYCRTFVVTAICRDPRASRIVSAKLLNTWLYADSKGSYSNGSGRVGARSENQVPGARFA